MIPAETCTNDVLVGRSVSLSSSCGIGFAGKDSCRATASGNGREFSVEGGVMMSISESHSIKLASNMDGSSWWIWRDFAGVLNGVGGAVFGIAFRAKI